MLILLETYVGSSDVRFETFCTGRKLKEAELRERGFISDQILRLNEQSDYVSEWFEVKVGDEVRVVWKDDRVDLDETFIVPFDLPDPPQRLDDSFRTGMWVYRYLADHCSRKDQGRR
jgi:hypothetical protein